MQELIVSVFYHDSIMKTNRLNVKM